MNRATLSIVGTPIGNLEDVTLRALRIFNEADVIVCEDTRVTKKLLGHFTINAPTISFHAQSTHKDIERVMTYLSQGKHVAVVTDAGTPGVSDPGPLLVSETRARFGTDVVIEAIPGPSALTTAISISGMRIQPFTFYGFLPHKKGRETLFKTIAVDPRASIFYESTHRVIKMLGSLTTYLPPTRRVGLFRELTKIHEESLIGSPEELLATLESIPEKQRGEFVVIVEGT